MKLPDLVDLNRLEKSLVGCDDSVFRIWKDTAIEIDSSKYRDILRIFEIYAEIPLSELRTDQVISYIEELLAILDSPEQQKSLIRAEAFQFRTFD